MYSFITIHTCIIDYSTKANTMDAGDDKEEKYFKNPTYEETSLYVTIPDTRSKVSPEKHQDRSNNYKVSPEKYQDRSSHDTVDYPFKPVMHNGQTYDVLDRGQAKGT